MERAAHASQHARDPAEAGTPTALILLACRADDALEVGELDSEQVASLWRLGPTWKEALGYESFVRLSRPVGGKRYAFLAIVR